jgi:Zn-dependent peptidase ImmA (M78 family)
VAASPWGQSPPRHAPAKAAKLIPKGVVCLVSALAFHSLTDTVLEEDQEPSSAEERFASAFALSFMMPASALRRRFNGIIETDNKFTPRQLVLLAHVFHVSPEAMCRQLERIVRSSIFWEPACRRNCCAFLACGC